MCNRLSFIGIYSIFIAGAQHIFTGNITAGSINIFLTDTGGTHHYFCSWCQHTGNTELDDITPELSLLNLNTKQLQSCCRSTISKDVNKEL